MTLNPLNSRSSLNLNQVNFCAIVQRVENTKNLYLLIHYQVFYIWVCLVKCSEKSKDCFGSEIHPHAAGAKTLLWISVTSDTILWRRHAFCKVTYLTYLSKAIPIPQIHSILFCFGFCCLLKETGFQSVFSHGLDGKRMFDLSCENNLLIGAITKTCHGYWTLS